MNLSYVAGYFDGEGSVTVQRGHNRCPKATIVIVQRDHEALARIHAFLEMGKLCQERTTGCWLLQVGHRDEIRAFVRLLYPHVLQKRAQLRLAYRIASLVGGRGQPISDFDCERRTSLTDELARVNLLGRAGSAANRHGGKGAVVA